jgi:hypothetical protein
VGGKISEFERNVEISEQLTSKESNEFRFNNGSTDTIESMFSEGGCGNGNIHNVIELFNLIAPTFKKLDINIIWYEYGQIMSQIYNWTKYLDEHYEKIHPYDKTPKFYSIFNKYMKQNESKMLLKPMKYYVYAE